MSFFRAGKGGGAITEKAFTWVGTVPSGGHIDFGMTEKPKRFVIFMYTSQYTQKYRAIRYDEDISDSAFDTWQDGTYYSNRAFNSSNELNGITKQGSTWGVDVNYVSTWSSVWFYAEA